MDDSKKFYIELKREVKSLKKQNLMLILCISFLTLASQSWSEERLETNIGVLLGFRNDAEDVSTYRTFWITNESGKVKVNRIAGILAPDGDNFWQIHGKWYEKETYSTLGNSKIHIEYLLARPSDQTYSVNEKFRIYLKSLEEKWVQVSKSLKLMFVGNRYVCIKQDNSYDSGEGLHRGEAAIFVREIQDLSDSFVDTDRNDSLGNEKNIPIEKIFGYSAIPYLKEYQAIKIMESEQNAYRSFPVSHNQTDEFGWGLTRRPYHWQLQIAKKWLYENDAAHIETYQLYDLPLEIPKTLVHYDEVGGSYRELKKAVPNAQDAVVSPNQDLWIAFTQGKVIIFTGKDLKDPVQVSISSKESLIMCEWALGRDVSNWDASLSEYIK
jgi:hypothetical protein